MQEKPLKEQEKIQEEINKLEEKNKQEIIDWSKKWITENSYANSNILNS